VGLVGLLLYKINTESGRTWRPSQDELGLEAAPSLRGLQLFTHKTIGFLGCATKRRPKTRRDRDRIRAYRETSKRRARDVIGELASEVSKARWMRVRSMSLMMY
jgi:hypothetical protein